jgi:hypothetical protein
VQVVRGRVLTKSPGQGMFPAARTDNKHAQQQASDLKVRLFTACLTLWSRSSGERSNMIGNGELQGNNVRNFERSLDGLQDEGPHDRENLRKRAR